MSEQQPSEAPKRRRGRPAGATVSARIQLIERRAAVAAVLETLSEIESLATDTRIRDLARYAKSRFEASQSV